MTEAPATNTNFYVMHIGGTTQSSTTLPGGSSVPGDFDVSGQLGVDRGDTAAAAAIFTSNNTVNTGSIQPAIKLIRTEKHPSGNVLRTGGLRAMMTNTSDAQYSAWEAEGNVLDNTAGSEDAYFRIRTVKNGTLASAARINQDGIVFDQSGAGIFLGGTGAANKLDDYEEGTWTADLMINDDPSGISYATRSASYIKIGKLVFVDGDIQLSSKGSDTGAIKIGGLPFTVYDRTGGTSIDGGASLCCFQGGTNGVHSPIGLIGQGGGTTIAMYISTTSGSNISSNLTDSKITNSFSIRFSLTYRSA
jgi:hypothetical protein